MHVIQPQIVCSSAQEFLDALSPLGSYFGATKLAEQWLFRGQGGDYPLIPSASRMDEQSLRKFASLTDRDIKSYEERLLAERDLLCKFFDIADRSGLIIPDDSQQLRSALRTSSSQRGDFLVINGQWSPDAALSLIALAQHYGIPTRLLDWTRQSFIAAFFAAESAWKYSCKDKLSERLVVWAFRFPEFDKQDIANHARDPIRIVTAPSATNPNLKAQQGVFTLLNPIYTDEAKGNYKSMEQVLEEIASRRDPAQSDLVKMVSECKLRKFTLRASESSELLRLLAKLGITPSAIYPGYHSIVEDLKMQNEWT